ncbi:phosphatase PAP2 family protein [Agrobacterium tumefaciens]|nr:phosphatase PAP2 family protein [Agrobacterium tumefaciens]
MENQTSRTRMQTVCLPLFGATICFVTMRFFDRATLFAVREMPEATKDVFMHLSYWTEPSKALTAMAMAVVLTALSSSVSGFPRPTLLKLFVLSLVSCVFVLCFVLLAKTSIGRERPLPSSGFDPFVFAPFSGSEAFESFPSAQAAIAAAICYCFMLRYPSCRPLALVLMVSVGLSRVVIERHWISDVVAGWLVGWLGAAVICALAQNRCAKQKLHR